MTNPAAPIPDAARSLTTIARTEHPYLVRCLIGLWGWKCEQAAEKTLVRNDARRKRDAGYGMRSGEYGFSTPELNYLI